MDPYQPHPPIDQIFFIFQAFIRVYLTTAQPIDFLLNVPAEQTVQVFTQHSLNARHVLLQIYGLFYPFVAYHPIHRQMLQDCFRFAIQMIHTKFGTTPQQPDNIIVPQTVPQIPDTRQISQPPPPRTSRTSARAANIPPLTRHL